MSRPLRSGCDRSLRMQSTYSRQHPFEWHCALRSSSSVCTQRDLKATREAVGAARFGAAGDEAGMAWPWAWAPRAASWGKAAHLHTLKGMGVRRRSLWSTHVCWHAHKLVDATCSWSGHMVDMHVAVT